MDASVCHSIHSSHWRRLLIVNPSLTFVIGTFLGNKNLDPITLGAPYLAAQVPQHSSHCTAVLVGILTFLAPSSLFYLCISLLVGILTFLAPSSIFCHRIDLIGVIVLFLLSLPFVNKQDI